MITIIGALGFKKEIVGGQITKNRVLLRALKKRVYNVNFVDTSNWKISPIRIFCEVLKSFFKSNYLILCTDYNGTRYLLPFLVQLNGLLNLKKSLSYVVIGGWLPSFLQERKSLIIYLNKITGIFVETLQMKTQLEKFGLRNTYYMPNFRDISFSPDFTKIEKSKNSEESFSCLKLVFFSRVTKEKGIEILIDGIKLLNEEGKNIFLDIYGPIEKNYMKKFFELIKDFKNISYKGILSPEDVETYKILSQYDLMAFPTFYSGEGFPGAIIDAYISGLPVLASDWKYNREIIIDNKTGKLFEPRNVEDFLAKLKWFSQNRLKMKQMKQFCIKEAKKYHVDTVIDEFIEEIGVSQKRNKSFNGKI